MFLIRDKIPIKELISVPWAKLEYEKMKTVQVKLLEDLHEARHNVDFEFIVQEMLIRTEFLRRDFTKRQMTIMTFIYNFSFGFGKEWAVVPKMKDWEIAGISKIKIRKEIDHLVEMGVIDWNMEENKFRLKDPREWIGASYNSGFNNNRADELFYLNLQDAKVNVLARINSVQQDSE